MRHRRAASRSVIDTFLSPYIRGGESWLEHSIISTASPVGGALEFLDASITVGYRLTSHQGRRPDMTRSIQFQGETELALRSGPSHQQTVGHRRARRKAWCHEVVLRDEEGWGPISLSTTDISASGVFVASNLLFEAGQGFLLEFDSPTTVGERIRVWSRVSRVSESDPLGCGMAFEFLDLAEDHQEEIAQFVLQ
jgi:hypothetical protein